MSSVELTHPTCKVVAKLFAASMSKHKVEATAEDLEASRKMVASLL